MTGIRSRTLIVVAAASWVLAGAAGAGEWIFDPKAQCAVWNPNPQPAEAIVYEGECIGGRAHGEGRVRWYIGGKLKSIYKGDYRGGKRHGYGKHLYPDGTQYEGSFMKGLRHGDGVQIRPNGDTYRGEFWSGKRHGNGVMDFANGFRYEGAYAEGKPHGDGTCYTPARGAWRCHWEQGKLRE